MTPKLTWFTVVENAGYEGERDVKTGFSRVEPAWIGRPATTPRTSCGRCTFMCGAIAPRATPSTSKGAGAA